MSQDLIKIKATIRKLLAVAASSTFENEQLMALKKAKELMAQHKLSIENMISTEATDGRTFDDWAADMVRHNEAMKAKHEQELAEAKAEARAQAKDKGWHDPYQWARSAMFNGFSVCSTTEIHMTATDAHHVRNFSHSAARAAQAASSQAQQAFELSQRRLAQAQQALNHRLGGKGRRR